MIDVLERMRAGNPVTDGESPSIEPVLARIEAEDRLASGAMGRRGAEHNPKWAGGLRWRYRLGVLGVLAVAAAFVLILGRGSPQGLSILARAYAATNSNGSILYYATSSSVTVRGRTHELGRSHVWLLDGRVRELTERGARERRETVFAPHLFAMYDFERNQTIRIRVDLHLPLKVGTLGPPDYVPVPVQNPISQLRAWYSEGHLRVERREIRAGVRYDVLSAKEGSSPGSARTTRIVIRAEDFAPVEVETAMRIGHGFRVRHGNRVRYLTRYSAFSHLPVNAGTLALMRMAPHPGASVETRTARPRGQ